MKEFKFYLNMLESKENVCDTERLSRTQAEALFLGISFQGHLF